MKADELHVMEGDELKTKLKASRRELYELRFKLAVGQLEDHRQVRKVRKDIARILTVIRQREMGRAQDVAVPAAVVETPVAAKRGGKPRSQAGAATATPAAAAKEDPEAVVAQPDEAAEAEEKS